jgi:phage terminase small subunit
MGGGIRLRLKASLYMTEHNEVAPGRKSGMLSNPRHEAFAHAIARGATIDAAYVEAGFKANRGNASRLNSYEGVKARVAELRQLVENLQKRSSHGVVLTEQWVLEQLVEVVFMAKAQEKPDLAGANKALNLIGLHLGLFVERKEIGQPGEFAGLLISDKRERLLAIAKQMGLVHLYSKEGQRLIGDGATTIENVKDKAVT